MPLKIPVTTLPSKGQGYSQDILELTPMSFKQMIDYDNTNSFIYLQRLHRDLKMLEQDLDLSKVSSFDIDALIFLKKCITFGDSQTYNFTYKCDKCGEEQKVTINLNQLSYAEVDTSILDLRSIEIGGTVYEVNVPSASYLKSVCEKFLLYKQDIDPKILALVTCLKFKELPAVKQVVENAVHDEILMLSQLASHFMAARKLMSIKCIHCGEEESVGVDRLSTNMFRDLWINQEIRTDRLTFKQKI